MVRCSTEQRLSDTAALELQQLVQEVEALFTSAESSSTGCALRVLVMTELVGDSLLRALLPINSLRNAALLAVDSPLVAMVDVDLLPSTTLVQARSAAKLVEQCQRKQLFVLPAFETRPRAPLEAGLQLAEQAGLGGKGALLQLVQSGALMPFAQQAYARGHNATDTMRWLTSDQAYPIAYQINYEPWYIASRALMPPYDVRFRGYGWNKVAQVFHTNASGFTFTVHPSGFLVHRPHPKSRAQGLYDSVKQKRPPVLAASSPKRIGSEVPPAKLFHRKVAAMRHRMIMDVKKSQYEPVVDAGTQRCRQQLQ
ncbi:glycosyltransferase-like protein LARGE2 [Haematococcus lacustris]|uniref:Glycosyltransferase-like protein LARGE2 n=1 Tax=Haematococcus lacustris TaxID=44745 RepID=A0A699ZT85_HAELA|nr:glycosyltransferase-like protein LARGE2 [Haematococcus lacustris]